MESYILDEEDLLDRFKNIMKIVKTMTSSDDDININEILLEYIYLIHEDAFFMNLFTKYKYNTEYKRFQSIINKNEILFDLLEEYRKLKKKHKLDMPKTYNIENKEEIKNNKEAKIAKKKNLEESYGLKAISKMVQIIIKELNECTFKELSNIIVTRCSQDKPLSYKDEINLERRIYSSLNILCSLEIIKKKGHNYKLSKNKIRYEHVSMEELSKMKVIIVNLRKQKEKQLKPKSINQILLNNQLIMHISS